MIAWNYIERLSERFLPGIIHRTLFVHKYLQFFLTGVTGVLLNLLVTWVLTEYVFGVENYFRAFLFGIAANLLFNFTIHTVSTFQTRSKYLHRFIGFILYSLSMASFQAWLVKIITPAIGVNYYLAVIASTIFIFSVVSFLLFKFFIFKEADPVELGGSTVPVEKTLSVKKVPVALAIIMGISFIFHIVGFYYVLEHKGMDILVSGDATVYVRLASDLWQGKGFMAVAGGTVPEMYRTPALPLLLAPFTALDSGVELYLLFSTGIMASVLIPFLVYSIGRDVFGRRAGLIGASLIALEPHLAFSSWSPLTDVPFLLAWLGSVWLYLRVRSSAYPMSKQLLFVGVAGLCAGYGVLLRPGNLMLFVLLIGGVGVWDFIRKQKRQALMAGVLLVIMFATTLPWQIRNYHLGGRLQLSPPIWAFLNVNYLSAITTVETGAEFSKERRNQKVLETNLLQRDEYSQIYTKEDINTLRHHVLSELWDHRATVMKLEGMILFSYFTNDNYYNQLIRMGFVDPVPNRASPTQIILREGIKGTPRILEEMRKQYYVPILSRLYQFGVLLLAGVALLRLPRRFALLLLALICFSALSTTVTTFGVEIRYRMPIMPILFLLVGYTIATGLPFLRKTKV